MSKRQGGFITSGGYRNAKYGTPSARSIGDRELVAKVVQIHGENYGVYGVQKMWHALCCCGLAVGREAARLMRLAGVSGKGKGRSPITTRKARREDTRPDLVHREFHAAGANRVWVAGITYVRTAQGFVYSAFVTHVFSPKIVGWALSDSMRTEALPLQALNQAITSAKETAGVIHHSDHGFAVCVDCV